MKTLIAGVLFSLSSLWSQSPDVLTSLKALQKPLAAMQDPKADRVAAARQLTDAMLPLADPNRKPSREIVDDFTKELAFALSGKTLSNEQLANLNASLWVVMKGSVPNLKSTSLLRDTLTNVGLANDEVHTLTALFLAIGEDVRGPDDLPVVRIK